MQSAYKHKAYVDLLIVDEVHTALSEKYSAIFENIERKQTLGLTATIPAHDYQLKVLNKYCPVVYSKLLHDVSKDQVVANYMIYNLEVPLSRRDRGKYQLFDTKLKQAQMELGTLKYKDTKLHKMAVFDIAKEYSKLKTSEPIVKYSKQF